MKLLVGLCLGFLLFTLTACSTPESADPTIVGLSIGNMAPDVEFLSTMNFEDDSITHLSDLRGKVVVITFWAAWCPFCNEEMPSLQALQDRYGDDLVILMVHNPERESSETGRTHMQNRGFTMPVVFDTNFKIDHAYHVRSIPDAYIIGRDGTVRLRLVGMRDWDSPEFHNFFDRLVSESEKLGE